MFRVATSDVKKQPTFAIELSGFVEKPTSMDAQRGSPWASWKKSFPLVMFRAPAPAPDADAPPHLRKRKNAAAPPRASHCQVFMG
jgi:hypothetical protein